MSTIFRATFRAVPVRPGLAAVAAVLSLGVLPLVAAQEGPAVELQVGTAVEEREPVGVSDSFPAEVGQLFAWSRVTGAEGTRVEHVWRYPEADVETVVPLEIGGSPWRTWSSKTIPPEWAGEWTVEVRDAMGNVLSSATVRVGS
jgi:hypothetical protein